MKKITMILAVSLLLLTAGSTTYAADTVTKIGYIDLQKIMLQSNEGKQAKTALEKQFSARKKELNEKKQELEDMQKSLETQSSMLTRDALMEKQAEFMKKRDAFLKLVQEYDKELQEQDGEMTKNILLQLQDIITKIGKDGHYTVILEKSQGGILYAPKEEDLTDKVLKQFNEETAKKGAAKN